MNVFIFEKSLENRFFSFETQPCSKKGEMFSAFATDFDRNLLFILLIIFSEIENLYQFKYEYSGPTIKNRILLAS